jgi:photosystem II stability/assembly factor-like uncharacterized protein
MKLRHISIVVLLFCGGLLWVINRPIDNRVEEFIPAEFNGPEQFALLHRGIRTPADANGPEYEEGFIMREIKNAKAIAARKNSNSRTQSNGVLEWKERGPANVPGRTRGLIVDPDDPTQNTWFAASAGGGVWKTVTGGNAWNLITPDLTNLATTVLAMATSNHNVIYLGTGESFGGLVGIRGNGIFKSNDRGQTWNHLPSTINFSDINRIIIHPTDANTAVAATAIGIYRTTNGGDTWTKVSNLQSVEDLKSTPGNFNIQYATQNSVGVLKSTNAGVTWALSNTGMSPNGRTEIAISPNNTNRIFASAQSTLGGSLSDLYVSDDAGTNWSIADVTFNNTLFDFLGGQGWYDNTILCDPFNANVVYHGGVSLFRTQLENGSSAPINIYSMEELGTSFISLLNYGATQANGKLSVTSDATVSVEIRFGPGKNQMAHRFLTPVGATSGVPDISYSYADYVNLPFEVWDITNNKQLMVSFRDQDRNGQFNLLLQNTDGPATSQSREYLFLHQEDYHSVTPSADIAVAGGQLFKQMYSIWPVLAAGKNWPADIVESKIKISLTSIPKINATTTPVADAYGNFDSKNRFVVFGTDVHPDHHNLLAIPTSGTTYKILNASDGGIFISNSSATPGVNQGDWTMVGRTYNTSQFYGADKRPGFDEYFGGMQDNGTWRSPTGTNASNTTNYVFSIGGDGFEVIWHPLDDSKLLGGSQGNNFRKSNDGGNTWTSATNGLSGTHPFVSKLASSKDNPDVVFTLSSDGVFRSNDFGTNWTLTPIDEKWGSTSFMDIEVSQANANIIWAGSAMVNSGDSRSLHVSTNGGQTFTTTNNYTERVLGGITKLASHPVEDSTAFALFSFAGKPKILRTKNLGQSWQDISGFGLAPTSSTGFPNVAVYCLYVRPDNPEIIWVGTEIGIVESLDNGQTWSLLEDFPNVAVWHMKGQDDQVVIATHGRGIWTAQTENIQAVLINPTIHAIGTSPQSELSVSISLLDEYDSTEIWLQNIKVGKLRAVLPGSYLLQIVGAPVGSVEAKLISYKDKAPFHSKTVTGEHIVLKSFQQQYFNHFQNANDFALTTFTVQSFGNSNSSLQSFHNYLSNNNGVALLKQPIILTPAHPFFAYSDVAIVEPGSTGSQFGQPQFKDYVIVEGTKDGVTWIPISAGYNASFNPSWLDSYTTNQAGNASQWVDHSIDLSKAFNLGDTLLFRFRLYSDQTGTSWGWSIDNLYIQLKPTGINKTTPVTKLSAFPNPTTGPVTISYSVTQKTNVDVEVYDWVGKRFITLSLGSKEPGEYSQTLTLPTKSGTYLLTLKTNTTKQVFKVIVSD